MRPESVLRARLLEIPDLVALVDTRIMTPPRPPSGPGSALPAIVYQRSSPGPDFSEHGGPSGLGMPHVQFSCYGKTEAEAWAVANAARRALDGWSNRTANLRIDGVTCTKPLDRYEDDTKIHHVFFDAKVRHAE